MKKGLILGLALVAVLSLGGCMFFALDGTVYGSIDSDLAFIYYYSDFPENSGFPEDFYTNWYYEISPGYHYFTYTFDSSTYYSIAYTVTADSGSILDPGLDKYFDIYLYSDGSTGVYWSRTLARSLASPVNAGAGPVAFSDKGVTVTVEVKQVDKPESSPSQIAQSRNRE